MAIRHVVTTGSSKRYFVKCDECGARFKCLVPDAPGVDTFTSGCPACGKIDNLNQSVEPVLDWRGWDLGEHGEPILREARKLGLPITIGLGRGPRGAFQLAIDGQTHATFDYGRFDLVAAYLAELNAREQAS